jgi:hypothetical protein
MPNKFSLSFVFSIFIGEVMRWIRFQQAWMLGLTVDAITNNFFVFVLIFNVAISSVVIFNVVIFNNVVFNVATS